MKRLFVEPHEDTVRYLQELFMGVPFNVEWDALCMEIGTTKGELTAKPRSVYHAIPGELGIYYDTATGCSHLLLPFYPSPKMARRHDDVGDAWGRPQFRPVMSFGRLQSNRRNHKAIINSIATAIVDTSPVFLFGNEQVLEDESVVPEYADFYRDYVAKGHVLNQVLLETDEGVE